ncbi:MAG: lactate racemase domain-containing protein, partial [Candidatus Sumerlaeaceae bacterium]
MPYGHEMLEAELPGEVVELRSAYPEPSDDEATLVAQALDEPLGTPPVEELARGKRSAVILIACRTRRTGSHIYVPMIVERLLRAGMPRHAISVVTATGSHDNFRPEDAALLLGP